MAVESTSSTGTELWSLESRCGIVEVYQRFQGDLFVCVAGYFDSLPWGFGCRPMIVLLFACASLPRETEVLNQAQRNLEAGREEYDVGSRKNRSSEKCPPDCMVKICEGRRPIRRPKRRGKGQRLMRPVGTRYNLLLRTAVLLRYRVLDAILVYLSNDDQRSQQI